MFLTDIPDALINALWRLKEPIVILIMLYAANKLVPAAENDSKSKNATETTIQAFSLPIALILFVTTVSQFIVELNTNNNYHILNIYRYRHDIYYLLLSFAAGSLIIALYVKIKTRKKSVA